MKSEPIETNLILEQAVKVERAKLVKIEELLQEREDIAVTHEARLEEIKRELKALGHKIPRKSKKTVDTSVQAG